MLKSLILKCTDSALFLQWQIFDNDVAGLKVDITKQAIPWKSIEVSDNHASESLI